MKNRDSGPPVHVHVPETTPVHVHMRRSPCRGSQIKREEGKLKNKAPWIPPGRLSCRRDRGQNPSEGGARRQRDAGEEEEEDEELAAVSKNLSALLKEQENLRSLKSSDVRGQQPRESAVLLRALVEAEIDGVAVTNQLTALKETTDELTKDKRLSKCHAASLRRHQQLLLERIAVFDSSNHGLRELLRQWTEYERESLIWLEQKDAIRSRLAESEAENIRLLTKLTNKEKETSKLAERLDFEKDKVETAEELSRVQQSTRERLQSELSRAEEENCDLSAQIQRMQQSLEEQQEELQVLQEELRSLGRQRDQERKEQGQRDQETLTLLTEQAEHAEGTARQLTARLQEKEAQLAQALTTSSDWCLRHSQEAAAKGQLEEELSALRFEVTELSSRVQSAEEESRTEREDLRGQIQHLLSENSESRVENQRLKGQLSTSEEKLKALQSEARQLKSSIRKQEKLVDRCRRKVQQARLESEESRLKLDATQKEAREVTAGLEREKEQLRRELLTRLRELETLPDRLRRSEQQLRDARQEADAHERRNKEHNSALAEVRHKVEQQGAQLETLQQRNLLLQEENNVLKEKIHTLERQLEDLRLENKDMSESLSSRDAAIRSVQKQLEEKTLECGVVTRQLRQTLDDAQKQVDDSMQRVLSKERLSQSKALELQSQLSRARSEQSQLQRSKEEMENRFKTQLQNMKERLEQSDSTNRTLQNYVQFLKTSYGNVFGESFLTS